jgi:hypothetical protein
MDSDNDDISSYDSRSSTSMSSEHSSSTEDSDSLVERFDGSSMDEWQWELGNADLSTSFKYFDGHALVDNRVIKPIDSFYQFITDDVLKLIVEQTNIYGEQRCVQRHGNCDEWKEVDRNQILAFLGIVFIMGFHRLPRIRDYWSQDRNLFTPAVADTMTRDDFYRIFSNIHLADNSRMHERNSNEHNKLYKVKDFLFLLKRNFQENYSLGSCVSIDEAIIKFKGRSSMKQYQPLKPTKRGYKVWALAESNTGYIYNFDIYTGKNSERQVSLGENVVMSLISGIELKEHQIFFDSYFNSLQLLRKLREMEIAATGTIRPNRKHFPTELKKKEKLERGDYRYRTSDGISVVKWMDKKEVFVASNYFDPTALDAVSRRNKDGSTRRVSCPSVVVQYNRYMGGVDLACQKVKYYAIDRKSKRHWMRIFLHFLNVSLMNSFIYYKNVSRSGMSALEYVSSVSTALVGNYCSRKRLGRPTAMSSQKKVRIAKSVVGTDSSNKTHSTAHMPEVISTYRRCAYCSTKAKEKRSNVMCTFCSVCLCVRTCFLLYHQRFV